MPIVQEIKQSPITHGDGEDLPYSFDTNPFNSSCPAAASTVIYDSNSVSAASWLSGTVAVAGCTITTPCITGLTAGCRYRMEIRFEDNDGNVWRPFAFIDATS